jgi:hypothetical protein
MRSSKTRDGAVRGVSFAVGAKGEALFSVRGGVEVGGTGADGLAVAEGDGVGGADSFEEAAVPGAGEVAGPAGGDVGGGCSADEADGMEAGGVGGMPASSVGRMTRFTDDIAASTCWRAAMLARYPGICRPDATRSRKALNSMTLSTAITRNRIGCRRG